MMSLELDTGIIVAELVNQNSSFENFTSDNELNNQSCSAAQYPPYVHGEEVQTVKWIAYGIMMPVLVTLGVAGNILNLVVLSRPNMTGVAYVYMRGYAAASLFALLCAIPFSYRVSNHQQLRWRSYPIAFFHGHVELFLGNSCITIGVLMLLALTVERFISVCFPAQARQLCSMKRGYFWVIVIPLSTFAIYIPNMFIATIHSCIDAQGTVIYRKEVNKLLVKATWFLVYRFSLEILFKLLPAIVLIYLNVRIIFTYRALCKKRRKMTCSNNQFAEESRLMFLLGGTSTLFFVCMTPMIVLSVTVYLVSHESIPYQIFRATANVLEVTNFAVTFYIYCLFSKDFRETFVRTFQSRRKKSVPMSVAGSASVLKDHLKPPL